VGPRIAAEIVAKTKPANGTLDEIDRRIIRAFRFGGRLSNSEVAREVQVSEGTVRRRLALLTDAGVLKFVAITSPGTVGLHVDTLIGVTADGDKVHQVAVELAGMPEVRYAGISMGSVDIWIGALFPSVDAWLEFRKRLAQVDGIQKTETFQITRVLKRNFDWVVPHDDLVVDDVMQAAESGGEKGGLP
jgi:Lrp/AsnC family transcriptional regulator for asnA, asnC and gidA